LAGLVRVVVCGPRVTPRAPISRSRRLTTAAAAVAPDTAQLREGGTEARARCQSRPGQGGRRSDIRVRPTARPRQSSHRQRKAQYGPGQSEGPAESARAASTTGPTRRLSKRSRTIVGRQRGGHSRGGRARSGSPPSHAASAKAAAMLRRRGRVSQWRWAARRAYSSAVTATGLAARLGSGRSPDHLERADPLKWRPNGGHATTAQPSRRRRPSLHGRAGRERAMVTA
jgi:hypothetical protein